MPDRQRCFVVSPIGSEGSLVRENADAALDYIIAPALAELGIDAVRADRFPEPGLITEQMIAAILDYDLCVVDLTGLNANVFYELALAQAAERPVVLMKHVGDAIPFDIKDYRLIEYDLKPKSIMEKKWIPILQGHVRSVLAREYVPPKLLRGRRVSRAEGIRSYLINARSNEFGEAPRFRDIVESADEYCWLMGVSLKVWGQDQERAVLLELSRRNVPVKILLMDPDNEGFTFLVNEGLPSESLAAVKVQTQRMAEHFRQLAHQHPNIEVRFLRAQLPHFQIILTERTALVLQYMFSRGTSESPLQQLPAGSELHTAFREEFRTLWDRASR